MSSTWLLNRSTTFANKRSANIFKEWTLYIFTSLIGALANFLTLSYVAQFDFALFHIPAYLGGTAIGLIINFLLYKIVVFKTSTD
jgi:putative flippase GtrA